MEEGESEGGSVSDAALARQSRRSFLKKAAVGAAIVGAAVTVPSAVMSGAGVLPSDDHREVLDAVGSGRLVAYVRNASRGEIVVMMGEREVRVQDFGIVSSLARVVVEVR